MAKNDTVLLDGIIQQRVAEAMPSGRQDEVFEYFGFEQVLKDYDLSRDEIESGWVDGRDDGGIDGFFTFVDNRLLIEPRNFVWPKRRPRIDVWILTCKHHDSFRQEPLNSLYATISELFDLSLDKDDLKGSYSQSILHARSLFHYAYRRLASEMPALCIRYCYISRGDTSAVADNVRARAEQVDTVTRSLFSECECTFTFIGAAELILKYRRVRKFSIALPIVKHLARGPSGYVVLARLGDYSHFVTDDEGNLRRYLFDSNVRDYLGSSQVNEDILESLQDASGPDFWWLNNGVTILATNALVVGDEIQLNDIQIVNGLQTTEAIYRSRQSRLFDEKDERALLVKVIVSTETTFRDKIIRATNNQNIVETAGLRATDKIQRDIEDHLDRHEWYYERRKNYYRNIGKPPGRFVTPMYLAAGYVAMVMKAPWSAARLRSRFMRSDTSYQTVFSETTPIGAWVAITEILKLTEQVLDSVRPAQGSGERFMASWRNLVAFIAIARVFGRFSYNIDEFMKLDMGRIPRETISEAWQLVSAEQQDIPKVSNARNHVFVMKCCSAAATKFGIVHPSAIGRRDIVLSYGRGRRRLDVQIAVDDEFVNRVDAELPAQPWKPGVRNLVAEKLGCTAAEVGAAIERLVKTGSRNYQNDGVVYASDGTVVARDPDR